jgi:hypothetical protein
MIASKATSAVRSGIMNVVNQLAALACVLLFAAVAAHIDDGIHSVEVFLGSGKRILRFSTGTDEDYERIATGFLQEAGALDKSSFQVIYRCISKAKRMCCYSISDACSGNVTAVAG